ncbi:hypothetical protein P879_10607 [Paragonimus westermani]|uniref:Dynein light chain n=1 Tax=Paragonimus westermani TaxID=34504 RepID=A0A8T0D4N2_9TREM|nr:hypothetical protein P879_10607 [Paragonimus westermani]
MITETSQVKINHADMTEVMQQEIVNTAVEELAKCDPLNEFPTRMKQFLDKKYGKRWHCVMGKNYCSRVSFLEENFLQFCLNGHEVIVFKTP